MWKQRETSLFPITAPPPRSLLMPDLEKNPSKGIPIFYKGINLQGLNGKSKNIFIYAGEVLG